MRVADVVKGAGHDPFGQMGSVAETGHQGHNHLTQVILGGPEGVRRRTGSGFVEAEAIDEPGEKRNGDPNVRQSEGGQSHETLGDDVADKGPAGAGQGGGGQREAEANGQVNVGARFVLHPRVRQDVGPVEQSRSVGVEIDGGVVHEEKDGPGPVTQRREAVSHGRHARIQNGRHHVGHKGLSVFSRVKVVLAVPLAGQLDRPPDEEDGREEMGPKIERFIVGREKTVAALDPAGHFRTVSVVDARLPQRFVHLFEHIFIFPFSFISNSIFQKNVSDMNLVPLEDGRLMERPLDASWQIGQNV